MKALSFRTRLTLSHLAAMVVILAVTAWTGYWGLSTAVHNQLDAALVALAETEVSMLATGAEPQLRIHETTTASSSLSFARLDRLVQIVDGSGQVLARSSNLGGASLPVTASSLQRLAAGETVFETLTDFGGEPTRLVSMPVRAHGALRVVQVAGSLDDVLGVVRSAGVLFALMAIALIAAVSIAGALLTRGVFRAIDDVVRQARHIGETNLEERLPHAGSSDEIGQLVETLNDMLARLEEGFAVQRRFTADASHELRSPLSRLRAEIEITLRHDRQTSEYRDALRSCLEEVERLTQLTDELLMLARIDANQERPATVAISIGAAASEVAQRLQPSASDKNIRIAVDASRHAMACIAAGQADLVLTNLLSNAVKYSPPDQTIEVQVAIDESDVVVRVSDRGPGIDPQEASRIFERFYRGRSTRTSDTSGVGLGLALSQSIVRANGGQIEASNSPAGGAVFSVRLPLAA